MTQNDMLNVIAATHRPATVHFLDFAERALRAAEIQVWRIWHRGPKPDPQDRDACTRFSQDVLIDIHFYFISLRNVYRYLARTVEDPALSEFRQDLEELNSRWFLHYSRGREAFEHIDQRLPGEKHQGRIVEVDDGQGNRRKVNYGIRGKEGLFTHSNETWDITESTFFRISQDVRSLLQRIIGHCTTAGVHSVASQGLSGTPD